MSNIINPKQSWKLLARHRNVDGAEIREYIDKNSEGWIRRYSATIRGWQKWFIAAGSLRRGDYTFQQVLDRVHEIREKIDAGDESVFHKSLYNPVLVNNPTITRDEIETFERGITGEYPAGKVMVAKTASDIYVGDDAGQVARRKARYTHRNWLFWVTKDGQKKAALMTPESVKQAMLDSGTQERFFLYHSSGGASLAIGWNTGAMWLRSFKNGHDYHFTNQYT